MASSSTDPDVSREGAPDVMNDPAYAPKDKDDPDTCRICRSEGTAEEPLFYPCKCSGSIKFVHQDCLVEWLSHSQKKHCELCKTRFRFTKLYHPQMPPTLPTTVFLRKTVAHLCKNFITWCRALLVICVWLFWLPWSMRFVWRGLFWLGDGGWVTESASTQPSGILATAQTFSEAVASATAAFTNQFVSSSDSILQSSRTSRSPTLTQDPSGGRPLTSHGIVNILLSAFGLFVEDPSGLATHNATSQNSSNPLTAEDRHTSLLSGLPILQNLTRSPRINATIIDVFEGQVITMSVMFVFVLIFLIREWVVGQQPVINMAAADAQLPAAPVAAADHGQPAPEATEELGHESGNEDNNERSGLDSGQQDGGTEQNVPSDGISLTERVGPTEAEHREELANLRNELRQTWETLSVEDRLLLSQSRIDQIQKILREDDGRGARVTSTVETTVSEAPNDRPTESASIDEHSPSPSKEPTADGPLDSTPESVDSSIPRQEREKGGETANVKIDATEPHQANVKDGTSPRRTSRSRSPMPQRIESFKATEIQRDLAELGHAGTAPANGSMTPTASNDNSEGEDSSEDSSDSWQPIPTPSGSEVGTSVEPDTYPGEENAPMLGSMKKGKEKMGQDSESEAAEVRGQTSFDHSRRQSDAHPEVSQVGVGDDRADSIALRVGSRPSNSPGEPSDNGLSHTPDSSVASEHSSDQNEIPAAPRDPHIGEENHAETPPIRAAVHDESWVGRILDWLWGDIAPAEGSQNDEPNDEHVIQDLAAEAPFVPFADAQPINQEQLQNGEANEHDNHVEAHANPDAGEDNQDPEVVAAARQAGIDPNDEDIEDLEGLMELFGMQGPITGLAQNAIFGAFLVAVTVAVAVWLPYILGKIVLLFLGNPITMFIRAPVTLANGLANLFVDLFIFFGSLIVYWTDSLVRLTLIPIASLVPWFEKLAQYNRIATLTRPVAESAFTRLASNYTTVTAILVPDISNFSGRSLTALRSMEHVFTTAMTTLREIADSLQNENSRQSLETLKRAMTMDIPGVAAKVYSSVTEDIGEAMRTLWSQAKLGSLTVSVAQEVHFVEGSLPVWTVTDRVMAILAGYGFFAFAGALYLHRGRPLTSSQRGVRIEAIITEMLQQAGGILKVIFIIGVEMIVFPLYCGLLLDFALLPLFEGATFNSGLIFAMTSPWTSGFAHWFVGTCYMFHFALFVSMCRRVLRKGVLHFIRDPDDPTFHPVRDVLEKSVSSQLRKIAFSALVYGALVIICLGMIVWGLFLTFPGILPVRWTSPEQLMDFPLDLLLFNLLALSAPLLVMSFKPSVTLQAAYDWWLRRCARMLRLSDFLFGQSYEDEEVGFNRWSWRTLQFWKRHEETDSVADTNEQDGSVDSKHPRTGRYVRAPASDQVRLPRGRRIFIEVNANNERLDGQEDQEKGPHGRNDEHFTKLYVPPWFRFRIGLFLICLWIFSAAIGLSVTILPLLLGRQIFHLLIADQAAMNDVYAFGMGSFALGGLATCALHAKPAVSYISSALSTPSSAIVRAACRTISHYMLRTLRVLYTYTAFAIFIPSLLALVLEFYVILPLHTYMGSGSRHIIHAIQDWTLGFVYCRIIFRVILDNRNSRPARVLLVVMRDGYLNPDARLATRCFLMPLTVLLGTILLAPLPIGYLANKAYFRDASPAVQTQVYRFAYPALAAVALAMSIVWRLGRATAMWRRRIRDEVYLIGERLHNFGDARAVPEAAHNARRIRT